VSPPGTRDLGRLVDLVARLRAEDGCPWDRKQTLPDLRAYLIEECHEVAAAITAGDWEALGEELGDLLFQIAFVARLGDETGQLELGRVIAAIEAKMIERHPHVFGDAAPLADADAVRSAWERRKLEKAAAAGTGRSLLDGVPASLPALVGAYRTTQKAAGVGFDWPDTAGVFAKLREEIAELEVALAGPAGGDLDPAAVREEIGDLLFTVANLARKLEVDPEAALAATNLKFRRRFQGIERRLAADGRTLAETDLAELDRLWDAEKQRER
jgi:MazG family protein